MRVRSESTVGSDEDSDFSSRPIQDEVGKMVADIRGAVLNDQGKELRAKLIEHLQDGPGDHETFAEIARSYRLNVVQSVLPTIIGGIMEKEDAERSRAKVVRAAVKSLKEQHNFDFKWNLRYRCFLEERSNPRPISETDHQIVERVFGEGYTDTLELGKGKSKFRHLKPLAQTCESLNLEVGTVKGLLNELRTQRHGEKKKQGMHANIVMKDIDALQRQLRSLVWETGKGPKIKDLAKKVTKRRKLSHEGSEALLEEEQRAPESISNEYLLGPRTNIDEGESDEDERPRKAPASTGGPALVDEGERVPPQKPKQKPDAALYPQVSEPAKDRIGYRVPKGAKDLWKYRVVGCGPWGDVVRLGEWSDSAFIHGHAADGVYAFDEDDKGTVFAWRLIGFHDSRHRHLGKDYLNSWIMLPLAAPQAQKKKCIVLSEMLSMRTTESGDGALRRYNRRSEDTSEILTKNGNIPLIENVIGGSTTRFRESPLEAFFPKADLKVRLFKESDDGSPGETSSVVNLYQVMKQSEDPLYITKAFYAEHFSSKPIAVPQCVQEELEDCIFMMPNSSITLRAPRMDVKGMGKAMEIIGSTMPVHYGEPAGAATGQTAKRLMRACRNAISPKDAPAPSRTSQAKPSPSTRPNLNGGSWGDHLHWRKGRPQDLTMRGMWEKRRVFQLEWLDDQAFRFFSARRCYALAGSTRLRTAPIAGSLLWSLLLRGERLVILWGPDGRYSRALVAIQKAGSLLVIPPGHEYAFYNIRSCISDEGNFYLTSFLRSYKTGPGLHVPGTLELLLARPGGKFEANRKEEIIAYFALVSMMTSRTIGSSGRDWSEDAADFVSLLSLPVFAYLPRNTTSCSDEEIRFCTKVLAWTAPFAAVVLHRSLRHCRGKRVDINNDSIDCQEADEAIETDHDEGLFDSEDREDMDTDFFDSEGEHSDGGNDLAPTHIDTPKAQVIDSPTPPRTPPKEDVILENGSSPGLEPETPYGEREVSAHVNSLTIEPRTLARDASTKDVFSHDMDVPKDVNCKGHIKTADSREKEAPEAGSYRQSEGTNQDPAVRGVVTEIGEGDMSQGSAPNEHFNQVKGRLSGEEMEERATNDEDWSAFAEYAMGEIDLSDLSTSS